MKKESLLELLKSDVVAFNEFRRNNPETEISLSYANLSYANLSHANLRGANLRGADLHDANLIRANLRDADLHDANLSDADLHDANLIRANLTRADLRDADLHDANLSDADLHDANLIRANLTRADLIRADLDMSCLPLWCGSLRMKTDIRLRVQVAFHFASLIANCEDTTDEEKKIYNDMLDYVNKFHREDVERLQPIQ